MRVSEVKKNFGKCLELVSMDLISMKLVLVFIKDILTVWSYSKKDQINERLNIIRDKMVEFGGLQSLNSDFKMKIHKKGCIN